LSKNGNSNSNSNSNGDGKGNGKGKGNGRSKGGVKEGTDFRADALHCVQSPDTPDFGLLTCADG